MKTIDEAYRMVLRDIMLNGTNLFLGFHDARFDGGDAFMYGIQTVMEYIALKAGEDQYERFSEMFTKNLLISKEKYAHKTTD